MGYVKNNFNSLKSVSSTLKKYPPLECFSLGNYQTLCFYGSNTPNIQKQNRAQHNKTKQQNKTFWALHL